MFIGFKDMHGNYIINTDNIVAIEEDRNMTFKSYGLNITITSGDVLELEWKKAIDRDKMMSYLYGQLVQQGLNTIAPNRFFDATED